MFYKSALILFFSWLVLYGISHLISNPIEGIYYFVSSTLRAVQDKPDWRDGSGFAALVMLLFYLALWIGEWYYKHSTIQARVLTCVSIATFLVVPLTLKDSENLAINPWWAFSMLYCFLVFFISLWGEKKWLEMMMKRTYRRPWL